MRMDACVSRASLQASMRRWRSRGPGVLLLALAAAAPPGFAQELKTSGFASLVIGRSSGSCQPNALASRYDSSCTRAIVDWSHGGVVTSDWEADVETRAGVQFDWQLTPQWSATTQLTARTLKDQAFNLEWAYLSYAMSNEWKLQLGRKRIPLYYYSDFQDVGYAYNTIRPSPDVYGWDVVNYNGASLSTAQNVGDWALRAELFAGGEKSRKNPYTRLFTDEPPDVSWKSLGGLVVEMSHDWFTARVSYAQSNFSQRERATGALLELYDGSTKAKQSFVGLALNGDWDVWQLRSEFGKAYRMEAVGYDASYHLVTLSRVFGGITATVGNSAYREKTLYPNAYAISKVDTDSLALRYELHQGGALKLQWDRIRNRGESLLGGNARVLSVAYDLVF